MTKKILLGTGLSGMVGSTVVERLSPAYDFENLSLETGVDITDPATVEKYLSKSEAPWVLHFAARTDVDLAEKEKDQGPQSSTWIVNVQATKTLVDTCIKYKKKLLYISTDYVFPGGDQLFTESDTPSPIGWYANTKYKGECEVQRLGDQGLIIRISFPYGATTGPKKDFVGRIRERFEQNLPIKSPTDQIFVPTYIEDITSCIELLLKKNASGIYHCVGSSALSSFEASQSIARVFGYDEKLVEKTDAATFYAGRAPRAFQLRISNAKISQLGLYPVDFVAGLNQIKNKERDGFKKS